MIKPGNPSQKPSSSEIKKAAVILLVGMIIIFVLLYREAVKVDKEIKAKCAKRGAVVVEIHKQNGEREFTCMIPLNPKP